MNDNNEEKTHTEEKKEVEQPKEYDLKAEIKSLSMNQIEFAEMLNLHINAISQWVRGINPTPQWVKVFIFHYKRSMLFDELKDKVLSIDKKGVGISLPPLKD